MMPQWFEQVFDCVCCRAGADCGSCVAARAAGVEHECFDGVAMPVQNW